MLSGARRTPASPSWIQTSLIVPRSNSSHSDSARDGSDGSVKP
jgi:hypothetical protein